MAYARRERHGMWKGGRRRQPEGYIAVLVDRDDLYASMRNNSGYVLEHRLVMARHLGRALSARETVHHINGNRGDNRVDNLQLRVGGHGKGVPLMCLDCGSHRIGPTPL